MYAKQVFADRARAAGANGFVLKDDEQEELADIVRRIADGEEIF